MGELDFAANPVEEYIVTLAPPPPPKKKITCYVQNSKGQKERYVVKTGTTWSQFLDQVASKSLWELEPSKMEMHLDTVDGKELRSFDYFEGQKKGVLIFVRDHSERDLHRQSPITLC